MAINKKLHNLYHPEKQRTAPPSQGATWGAKHYDHTAPAPDSEKTPVKEEAMDEQGTGGMSSAEGGPILAMKDNAKEVNEETNLQKIHDEENMQFESFNRIVEEKLVSLKEAIDDPPNKPWAKFGDDVDDFINDCIDKASKLFDEGEKILADNDDYDPHARVYVTNRMSFLKNLSAKLAQKFEGLRREN